MDARVSAKANRCQLHQQPEQQDDRENVAIEGDQAGALTAELEPHIAIEELQWREQHEQEHITAELGGIGKGDAEQEQFRRHQDGKMLKPQPFNELDEVIKEGRSQVSRRSASFIMRCTRSSTLSLLIRLLI